MENNKNTYNSQDQQNQKTPAPNTGAEKPSVTKRVGDAIERLGDKIEHKGFKKVGDAIEKLGDKVEHAQDGAKH